MKFTKMSLVAALLVGSSAFAIENVKVSGDAKLFYATEQGGLSVSGASSDMFNKDASVGQVAASLSVTADLTKNVSFGGKATALSTLGLEGQLVNQVWEAPNGLTDTYIVNDLWLAATVAKTTAKIGRMELDTPLVFTEKWSLVENTFESAVIINTDIPNTTLVGAYVGGSNSQYVGGTGAGYGGVIDSQNVNTGNIVTKDGLAVYETTNNGSTFSQFYNGAYAAGVINNSWKPLTVQAWYYNATKVGTAYWLQTDLSMDGILFGAQFTGVDLGGYSAALKSNTAYAIMAGYEMKDMFTAKFSYSIVSDDAGVGAGFNLAGSGQSKLYTEAWWNYGRITQVDTTAMNLTIEAPIGDIVDLGLYATMASSGTDKANDLTEVTITASHSFGPLDASIAVIYTDTDTSAVASSNDSVAATASTVAKANTTEAGSADTSGAVQAYLTYNF